MKKVNFISVLIVLMGMNLVNIHAKIVEVTSTKEVQTEINGLVENDSESTFLHFVLKKKKDEFFFNIGLIPQFKQYAASYRNGSCWMIPSVGEFVSSIPSETQFLLVDRGDGNYMMLIPLVDNVTRCSLRGTDRGLQLIAETGDRFTPVDNFLGLYMLTGKDPQMMIKRASKEIQEELQSFELRNKKDDPWFADYFGWCTWNALYTKLSADTLLYAVDNFQKKEIPVKYMIIDAGWQSNRDNFLNSYAADKKKFPNGLAPVISEIKASSSIERVFTWQALWGMFKGLDAEVFSHIGTPVHCELPPRMQANCVNQKSEDVTAVATVGKEFYPGKAGKDIIVPDFVPYMEEYSDYLRRQGVDGLKIDAMTWVESTGNGRGGRVAAMKNMMQGLQSSASVNFNNELINCSSCSNDYLYNTVSSNVTRSSGDFFPDRPESHGFHIFTNVHTSFWMGEIILPDWDMFQSGHVSGDYHAAARSISGGPVYTTEEIGTEDKIVLDKLMTSYGRLPRCVDVGRICTESFFTDPDEGKKAVKFYNKNRYNAVVGVFNCSYNPLKTVSVTETIKSTDINDFKTEDYVVYSHTDNKVIGSNNKGYNVKLGELEYNIFTFVPIVNGLAPIGIVGKYNPGGMILNIEMVADNIFLLTLMDGGIFEAYCEKAPIEVLIDGDEVEFSYNKKEKMLNVNLPTGKEVKLTILS